MRSAWRPVVCLLLSCGTVLAADPVPIKPSLTPGTRWHFDSTTEVKLDNTATLNGQNQPFTIVTRQHRIGTAEVLTALDGVVTSIRVTFDDGSSDQTTIANNPQQTPFPYAGKTVSVTRGANGTITDDFSGEAPAASVAELHGLLDSELIFLPTHPVAVGDEWSADPAALSRMLQLSGDDRAGMTLKLLDTKSIDSHDVAEIKVSTVATRRQGQMQIRMILQGKALVDLKSGHTINTDLTGTVEDRGEQPGPGPGGDTVSYHIEGGGTFTSASVAPLLLTSTATVATPPAAPTASNPPAASPAINPLGSATADPFAGTFSDGKLTIDGATKDGGYVASMTLGDRKYPATATIDRNSLTGSFTASGNPFSFNATVDADVMTLTTGGKTYTLKRTTPAAPSAPATPANPLGQSDASPAIQKLPGYTVVVSTDAGKTLSAKKPASDVKSVFKTVFPELANYFDDRPAVSGAFEDARDHKSATASFTAHLNGQAQRGVVSCHINGDSADVVVTYCRADADAAAWEKLMNPGSANAPAALPLTAYAFPDGSGTIGLAEGWTTQSPSAMQAINVQGPADQIVTIGFCLPVQTPDSPLVQMMRQNAANARQMGFAPPPQTAPIFIAPYTGPVEALTNLIPQLSDVVRRQGQPAIAIEHIQQTAEVKPNMQGGHAGVLTYDVTRTDAQGGEKHRRAMARVETSPIGPGGWLMYTIEASAPTETFDHDLPTMLAIINSLRENPQVCAQIAQNNHDAQQQQFQAQQEAHREQIASYDAHNKAWEEGQVQTARTNANFIEVLRGERAVLDTSTGEKSYADLSDAGKIVDKLNETDPGRYQELPLRDELYPLPAGGH